MARILLVAPDWTTRALVGAQLAEEGHEVDGSLTLDEGLLELRTHSGHYDLVVVDLRGADPRDLSSPAAQPQPGGSLLARLATAGPPALLLAGPFDLAALGVDPASLGFRETLRRPLFVGDVVAAVRRALGPAGPGPGG